MTLTHVATWQWELRSREEGHLCDFLSLGDGRVNSLRPGVC